MGCAYVKIYTLSLLSIRTTGHSDRNGMYVCTNIHACYHCPVHLVSRHLDGFGTYLCTNNYTYMLPLSVPSICTTGTLGQKWDVPMDQYTCTLPPVSVSSICTVGTLEWKWDVPMYQYTRMLPLSRQFIPLEHSEVGCANKIIINTCFCPVRSTCIIHTVKSG